MECVIECSCVSEAGLVWKNTAFVGHLQTCWEGGSTFNFVYLVYVLFEGVQEDKRAALLWKSTSFVQFSFKHPAFVFAISINHVMQCFREKCLLCLFVVCFVPLPGSETYRPDSLNLHIFWGSLAMFLFMLNRRTSLWLPVIIDMKNVSHYHFLQDSQLII